MLRLAPRCRLSGERERLDKMAVSFRLEEGDDFLSWTTTGDNPTIMTKEEAMVVAVAEIAGALREIALFLRQASQSATTVPQGPRN